MLSLRGALLMSVKCSVLSRRQVKFSILPEAQPVSPTLSDRAASRSKTKGALRMRVLL